MGVIEYDSNNSGGDWWLDDKAWARLEKAGWIVHWIHDYDHEEPAGRLEKKYHTHKYSDEEGRNLVAVSPSGERFLGALATSAAKECDDPKAAVEEWEDVTGQTAGDMGCSCCGTPHSFTYTDNDGKSSYGFSRMTETNFDWD